MDGITLTGLIDKQAVADRARGQWRRIITALTDIPGKSLDGGHGACPKCGGNDRFRFSDYDGNGSAVCNQCFGSRNGDGFAVLQWYNQTPFVEVLKSVAEFLGVTVTGDEKKPPKTKKPKAKPKPKPETQKDVSADPFASWRVLDVGPERLREAVEQWCARRPGMCVEAVLQTGVQLGEWPAKRREPDTVLGFTGYSYPKLADGEVRQSVPQLEETALHMYRADGSHFPATGGEKSIPARKSHNGRGSQSSWIFVGGRERFERSLVVHKVEGLTDGFALLPILPAHHSIVTTTTGAQWRPDSVRLPPIDIFAGKRVVVWGDADQAGQIGQETFSKVVRRYAVEVYVALLPFKIEPKKGADLRDWMCQDEWSWQDAKKLMMTLEQREYFQREVLGLNTRQYPVRDLFDVQERTELANARHFCAEAKFQLRWCGEWEKWLAWDGRRWEDDHQSRPLRIAKRVAGHVWDDYLKIVSPKFPGDEPKRFRDGQKFAQRSSSAGMISAMPRLVKDELPVLVRDLDPNIWLLNVLNGVVDMKTGRLHPHHQQNNITKLSHVVYDEDAHCPRWEQFLAEIFEGHEDCIPFLRRFIGYCLTGNVKEQQFPVFWGSGSNGKSTFMNIIQEIFGGDYSCQQPATMLMNRKNEVHPSELATMYGKRLAIMSETSEHGTLDEAKVKTLTGGEPISCRRMGEDWWQYNPEMKLVLVTNHKPTIFGQDHAIWRRVLLVPFLQTFGDDVEAGHKPKDPDLMDKLEGEYSGILNWMIQGCREWQAGGLQVPESITTATDEYRQQQDVIGQWFADCCHVNPDLSDVRVRVTAVNESFEFWQKNTGAAPIGVRKRKLWLEHAGFQQLKSSHMYWVGFQLKASDENQPVGSGGSNAAYGEFLNS